MHINRADVFQKGGCCWAWNQSAGSADDPSGLFDWTLLVCYLSCEVDWGIFALSDELRWCVDQPGGGGLRARAVVEMRCPGSGPGSWIAWTASGDRVLDWSQETQSCFPSDGWLGFMRALGCLQVEDVQTRYSQQ